MQNMLMGLYASEVPIEEQEQIRLRIEEETLRDSEKRAANTRWAAYRITEHGSDQFIKTPTGDELLTAAGRLCSYFYPRTVGRWPQFSSLLFHGQEITREEFEQMAVERQENTGRITGVFEIDFDAGTFSAVHIMDGWHTYRIHDVSIAAYHAFRKWGLSTDQRWERLLEKLSHKELTPNSGAMVLVGSRRLRVEEITFQDEMSVCGSLLNFYVPVTFDPDEVFGTGVTTDANDDYLNIYANFDLDAGEVCDALEVILCRSDGEEIAFRYPLTEEERTALTTKMDAYCLEQVGQGLEKYRSMYLGEMENLSQEQQL